MLTVCASAWPVLGAEGDGDPDEGRPHKHRDAFTRELHAYYFDEGTSFIAAAELVSFQALSFGFTFGFVLQGSEFGQSVGSVLLGAGIGAVVAGGYLIANGGVTAAQGYFLNWVTLGGWALAAMFADVMDRMYWSRLPSDPLRLGFGLVGPLFAGLAAYTWHLGVQPTTGQTQLVATFATFGALGATALVSSHRGTAVTAAALLGAAVVGGGLGVPAAMWIKPSRLHTTGIALSTLMGVLAGFLINAAVAATPERDAMLYWTAPVAMGAVGLTLSTVVPQLPSFKMQDALVTAAPLDGGAKLAVIGRF